MKTLKYMLVALLLSVSGLASASVYGDYEFQQERMVLSSDTIYVLSSFDSQDHITAYTYYGTRLWDASFQAKITSWQLAGDYIFVFSKGRSGYSTYLTCLDSYSGTLVWQRP